MILKIVKYIIGGKEIKEITELKKRQIIKIEPNATKYTK